VDVITQPKQIIVRIRGDGLFDSGSTAIKPVHHTLLLRIAEALKTEPGKVLVTGHTDNIPIKRSLRFPSNWHLSQQRAEAVVKMLVAAGAGAAERFTAEGRADKEPLVSNDTAEGRARNRRVEIILHTFTKGS
jgi:type VI secretion system protein ImpK